METKNIFDELNSINVNDYTEKKSVGYGDKKTSLTYLSWTYAWAEIKKRYPNAVYEVKKFENNLPYVCDKATGYMVFTSMTIDGITHEMWLPVMDGANRAMKSEPYTMFNKEVSPATMFDINKTIMRCLVKNIAMFGLGLYIFSGEDLPEYPEEPKEPKKKPEPKVVNNKQELTQEQLYLLAMDKIEELNLENNKIILQEIRDLFIKIKDLKLREQLHQTVETKKIAIGVK